MSFNPDSVNIVMTLHPQVALLAQLMLIGALFLALFRLIRGPNTVDRIVALDLIAGVILALTLFYAITQNKIHFMNVGLAVAVIAFLGTVAMARYLEKKYLKREIEKTPESHHTSSNKQNPPSSTNH